MRYGLFVVLVGCHLGSAAAPCAHDTQCEPGLFCVKGECAAPSCTDKVRDGQEADVDCGGICAACPSGMACTQGSDCASHQCSAGLCTQPSCTDAVKNGNESDTDCGGNCGKCAAQRHCESAGDCLSAICASDTCVAASCTDGITNEGESDIDCGGSACRPCTASQTCNGAADCDSQVCTSHACVAATCDDNVKNGAETDIDCGGTCDTACALGRTCARDADCSSNVCEGNVCVDCRGASDCLRAPQSAECVSYVCTANACKATALVPTQIADDCSEKVCNVDFSLTLAPDATDVNPDATGDCYKYTCSCNATSCTKVILFESTDTPAQVAGDCHVEECVNATPVPHSLNAVDTNDKPLVVPACHSALCDASGNAQYPVNTANVPDDGNSCTEDYCDASGNSHHVVQPVPGFCANQCGTGLTDGCGVVHDCHAENNPCSADNCGMMTNGCGTYTCTHSCGGQAFCAPNNLCEGNSTTGGGGSDSGSDGGSGPPGCCPVHCPTNPLCHG